VKIWTGLKCNARCRFCYYWDSLNTEDPSTEEIKAKLRYAKKHGIKDVDFSGGEPTIRRDLPDLVSYAKDLGFRYICVITNGIKLANKDYFEKLVECGLNDVLLSIEGHNAEIHDYLTRVTGSFDRINKAIVNAKEFGVKLRTNTTVTSVNYKYLPKLAEFLANKQPDAVNFILFNDWCSAYKVIRDMACKYSDAAPYLREAIDILDSSVRKITVRYIPFCFMVGYEKYVCNLLQKKYDPDEWVDSVKLRLVLGDTNNLRASLIYWKYVIRGIIKYPKVLRSLRLFEILHDAIIENMREGYVKSQRCKKCKYFNICDGLERSYADVIGLNELEPVTGDAIRDPCYYRREYAKLW